jgi:hypothetical protein
MGLAGNSVMDGDGERLSFLGRELPETFACREVSIECRSERPYDGREWVGALVVVEEGELELECLGGSRSRFARGAVLFFDSLPLRTLRNPGDQTLLLTAVTRRQAAARIRSSQGSRAMKSTVIRYKVKADQAEENAELIRAVYAELEQASPDGFHYATFRLEDGLTFIHVASHDDGVDPLAQLEAFRRFRAGIHDRCDEPPVASAADEIGSFRLFGG